MQEIIRFGVQVLREEQALDDQSKMETAQGSLDRLVDEIARVGRERKAKTVTPDIVVAALIELFCGIWPFCRREGMAPAPAVGEVHA